MALSSFGFQPLPKESAALGVTKGKPISSGFVFVNGKHLKPPYVVERWGTGIRINRTQVTGPLVSWEEFLKTQPEDNLVRESAGQAEEPKEDEAKSPGEGEEAKADGEEPKTEGEAAKAGAQEQKAPEVDASAEALADLFGDGPAPTKAKDEGQGEEAKAKEEVQGKEAKAKVEGQGEEPKAKEDGEAAKPAAPKRPSVSLKGKFVKNAASKKLLLRINDQRTRFDKILRGGGVIFFGDAYRPFLVNDRQAAETMVETLAQQQKKQRDSDDFSNAVSVYFHQKLAEDLFRNRIDYRALQERLKEMEDDRKLMKMLNR